VTFLGFGESKTITELTKQVIDFKRPSLSFDPIEIPVYNSRIYLAGKPTWAEVTCNVRDDAAGEASKLVGEQMQKQFDFMEQSSAAAGIDYKFTTTFEVLDGGNGSYTTKVLETWQMYGCYLSTADYGDFNYATNEPAQIALTIRYDNAIQTAGTVGIGTLITRAAGKTITG
jgi:hypothetical protein